MNIVKRTIFDVMNEKSKDNDLQFLQLMYKNACDLQDSESASGYARRIRDTLLQRTDKEMLIDRWLESTDGEQDVLRKIKDSGWGKYRAHLRDIPAQDGFPFNIDWGNSPMED